MAELIGKVSGLNCGKAERGHHAQPKAGFFGADAVVGGKMEGRSRVVACLFGDGACGAGALHETMNVAASGNCRLCWSATTTRFRFPRRGTKPWIQDCCLNLLDNLDCQARRSMEWTW